MKAVLSLLFVVVVGWVVKTTFFGTNEERETRDRLFQGLQTTGKAIGEILSSEKGKFSTGKYDDAIDKVNDALGSLKSNSKSAGVDDDAEVSASIAELEQKKADLERKVELYNTAQAAAEKSKQLAENKKSQPKSAKRSTVTVNEDQTVPKGPSVEELDKDLSDIQHLVDKIGQNINK